MPSYPLLQGKRAVVFGAGGSIGSEVAKAFASEGAEVFLAGRSEETPPGRRQGDRRRRGPGPPRRHRRLG
jgi:NAD(P)-dependent dehydrogenase (short-subunit alcohol dehydrogenase family)